MFAVTGGLHFGCLMSNGKLRVVKPERDFIYDALTAVSGYDERGNPLPTTLLSGASRTGAERVAEAWADRNMLPVKRLPLKTSSYGKKAPEMQRDKILEAKPDFLLVFPMDKTDILAKALCSAAEKAGIPTFHASY